MCDGAGEIHDVPIEVIRRPLVPMVDEDKVGSLCGALTVGKDGEIPPVTVLWVQGSQGGDYYFAFGGCHRYEAYKRSGRKTIPAILQKIPLSTLQTMLGASAPKELL